MALNNEWNLHKDLRPYSICSSVFRNCCFRNKSFTFILRVSDEKDARSYLQALASKMNEELEFLKHAGLPPTTTVVSFQNYNSIFPTFPEHIYKHMLLHFRKRTGGTVGPRSWIRWSYSIFRALFNPKSKQNKPLAKNLQKLDQIWYVRNLIGLGSQQLFQESNY